MTSEEAVLEQLSKGIDGQVIGARHPDYDRARRVWNGAFDRFPWAIVRATTREDVQHTVSVARDAGVALAVRGGAHSLAGFSTCDRGIVLDLSVLNTAVVDPAQHRARVAGGALLHDLDTATIAHGQVVPAGVVSHTGVAGLTLLEPRQQRCGGHRAMGQ